MIVLCPTQRTDAWYAARCGRLTGSRAGDMMARIKTGEAAARRDLRLQLVCERLTGQSQEDRFVTKEMQYGIDREGDAVLAYEALTGYMVRSCGFLGHDELMAGTSPDGAIGNFDGALEIKCPKSATHYRYLRGGVVPSDYLYQVQHHLWITGAAWCDFVSFDDRFPSALRLFRIRVERDEPTIAAYEVMARAFLAEVARECREVSDLATVAA